MSEYLWDNWNGGMNKAVFTGVNRRFRPITHTIVYIYELCIYVYIYMCIYIYMCVYICVYIYVYIYRYIYIYTHTLIINCRTQINVVNIG